MNKVKLIIAGSRTITDPFFVELAINQWRDQREVDSTTLYKDLIEEIVCGCAAGVDLNGEAWGGANGIPSKRFYLWDKYGRGAGFVRNQQMGWYGDELVAIWDGISKGVVHMIEFMNRLKKPVLVYQLSPDQLKEQEVYNEEKRKAYLRLP